MGAIVRSRPCGLARPRALDADRVCRAVPLLRYGVIAPILACCVRAIYSIYGIIQRSEKMTTTTLTFAYFPGNNDLLTDSVRANVKWVSFMRRAFYPRPGGISGNETGRGGAIGTPSGRHVRRVCNEHHDRKSRSARRGHEGWCALHTLRSLCNTLRAVPPLSQRGVASFVVGKHLVGHDVVLARFPREAVTLEHMSEQQEGPCQQRRFVHRVAWVTTLVLCIAPAATAAWAWSTHFAWLRNGAYARNSYPMRSFAISMIWISAAAILAVVLTWWIARRYGRGW
jgi:hypothetical protein